MFTLLNIQTTEELQALDLEAVTRHILDPVLTQKEFEHALQICDAFWVYAGEPCPNRPHALLTSGAHSNGYVNLGAVLREFVAFRRLMALGLVGMFRTKYGSGHISCVVGSATSATDLAGNVAGVMGARHLRMEKGEDKGQTWPAGQSPILPGDIVLHIEELVTTASSTEAVRKGIADAHDFDVQFASYIPCVVDRSDPAKGLLRVGKSEFISLFRYTIQNFDPPLCVYCKAGSEAIPPKANWERLTKPDQFTHCACGCWHNIAETCPG